MTKRAVIAVDVGGTTVDAAVVLKNGRLAGELVETSSPSAGTEDEIVEGLVRVIEAARAQTSDCEVEACSIAMPAPFDYEAGISHMVHKFQAIHGIKLGKLLQARTGLSTYFINDAGAFGLGVGWLQLPGINRFVALTIGTGLGGSFIEDGKNVEQDARVPLGGEVWDLPYKEGILEDYVSARAVVAAYDTLKPDEQRSAQSIAHLALQGDPEATKAYETMGMELGRGLAAVFAHFAPEKIVIGGKVGLSLKLFQPALQQALTDAGLPSIEILQAREGNLAIWGAARHVFDSLDSKVSKFDRAS
jgi:glucokinase